MLNNNSRKKKNSVVILLAALINVCDVTDLLTLITSLLIFLRFSVNLLWLLCKCSLFFMFQGKPVFKEITHDCQYMFEWRTSVVCDEHEDLPDSGAVCQIMFEAAKTNVDLKPLYKAGGYDVKFGNKAYKVNVCGSACNDSGVCTPSGESYGLFGKSFLKWDYDSLKLSYYEGDACQGSLSGHKTTAVFFKCDMEAGFGAPVADDVMDHLQCMAVFVWKTNVTCIEGIYSTDSPSYVPSSPSVSNATGTGEGEKDSTSSGNVSPDTSNGQQETPHSSVIGIVATVIVVSGIVFVIILVLFKSRPGKRVLGSARRLLGLKGYSDITQSQTESSTLLGTTRVFRVDDSDDDLLRI